MSFESLYPDREPYASGQVALAPSPHRIWFEQYGNPQGEPVIFVHGGPGSAVGSDAARFFDPDRFRVINYHQRGTGKSTPFLSLEDNTTRHLVDDIAALRRHLGITGKVHLFGGSWGSFLILMYALTYPDTVASMTLRGIFLGRQRDLHDAYQVNAGKPPDQLTGAAAFFPEAWRDFVDFIPEAERGDLLVAYHRRIHASGPERTEAARRWYAWEDAILRLRPLTPAELKANLDDEDEVMSQAVLETHFFRNGCFLDSFGGDGFILDNLERIAAVPVTIVQGRYDVCCPRGMADELASRLNQVKTQRGLPPVDYRITVAGHTMNDDGNRTALLRAVRELPRIAEETNR